MVVLNDVLQDGIGSIELIQQVGTDHTIAACARVSYANDLKNVASMKDFKLIKYLLKHKHGTPFEHNLITYRIVAPLFVVQQMLRHRIGTCLTGDAKVTFLNSNGEGIVSLQKSMQELWLLWSQGEKHPNSKTGYRDSKARIKNMRIRCYNEESQLFEAAHIKNIFHQGRQHVFEFKTESGYSLTCTYNHRILTNNGWQRIGDALGLDLNESHATFTKDCYVAVNGQFMKGCVPWNKEKKGYKLTLSQEERKRNKPKPKGRKLTAKYDKIISVTYKGIQETYDLEIDGDHPNFVANGIIVHNSFNQQSGRYTEFKKEFYVPLNFRIPDKTNHQSSKMGFDFIQTPAHMAYEEACHTAFDKYEELITLGVAREQARCVLPHCTYTSLYITFNLRSLFHFLDLRLAEDAQWEIQRYAEGFKQIAIKYWPETFNALEELHET